MIRIENLHKSFRRPSGPPVQALAGVSLEIPEGSFFGLLGSNGAGKSTLIACLTGYYSPDEGTIFHGAEVFDGKSASMRREIGFVPQEIALYETLSALENLRLFGRLFGLSASRARERADEVLELVGLTERAMDTVKSFSGGMKRRVNLAAALLHKPRILLCDEPTVGVDPQSRNAIFEILEQLHAGGMTILYTTHYMEEVERLCERIAIVDHGRVLAQGSLHELLDSLPFASEIRFAENAANEQFSAQLLADVVVQREGPSLVLRPPKGTSLASVLSRIEAHGIPASQFSLRPPSLEHLFLQLTGRTLRD